jgi:hypothetical protein
MCEVDQLRRTEVSDLSDADLHAELERIERTSRMLEAERARRIAEAERRRSYASDGLLSMAAWLRHRLGLSGRVASEHVRIARALRHMPNARAALAAGQVSTSAVALLVGARAADPDGYRGSEKMLVDLARQLPARDLARAIEHWRALCDAASGEADARRFERRGLYVSPMLDGMVRIDGELDPETGQSVLTAIGAMTDAWARSETADARTPAKRRADALGEICRAYLDRSDRPVVAGQRPHVVLTVPLGVLRGAPGTAELGRDSFVSPETARRLACDASVSRVIAGGSSEPLEVGRRTPVVPAGLRRAVAVRDGGCRFPGCDRPEAWCDAHHVVHWADGGPTELSNLLLLCRPHHRAIHTGFGLDADADGDGFVFRRPDGSVLQVVPRAGPTVVA